VRAVAGRRTARLLSGSAHHEPRRLVQLEAGASEQANDPDRFQVQGAPGANEFTPTTAANFHRRIVSSGTRR
jgi:hypothetical protein